MSAKSSNNGASGNSATDPRAAKLTTRLAKLAQKMPGSSGEDEVHKVRTHAATHYHTRRAVAEIRSQLQAVTTGKKPPSAAGRAAGRQSLAV